MEYHRDLNGNMKYQKNWKYMNNLLVTKDPHRLFTFNFFVMLEQ